MTEQQWHPGNLLQLSGSYWQAFALHAGVKLDLFSLLAEGPQTASQAAARIGTQERSLATLLNALGAMGLVHKNGDRYAAAEAARRFLAKSSDAYIGHIIMHHHFLSTSWARLDEAVLSGESLRRRASHADETQREAFLMGMFNLASLQAPDLVAGIDLGGRRRLLDLGGGPGTYAIHFCRENEGVEAVVYDLPTTQPFAEKTIARFGLSDRIRFMGGDYTTDALQGRYDVVWLSHILHAEGPEMCRKLVANAVNALAPGGLILIHEFILDDTMDGPLFPALFSLNMLIGTQQGRAYSESQLRDMLLSAGISDIQREAYKGPTDSAILRGVKRDEEETTVPK